ncbi:3235_t:CDS:1, partial [Paraglomus brasilianum]
ENIGESGFRNEYQKGTQGSPELLIIKQGVSLFFSEGLTSNLSQRGKKPHKEINPPNLYWEVRATAKVNKPPWE